jgi:hypothetical protein
MSGSGVLARSVALVGAAAVWWRRLQGSDAPPAVGPDPQIPAARPQGASPR